MGGSRLEWVGVIGSGWEWLGVSRNGWKWVEVKLSITHKSSVNKDEDAIIL